MFTRERQQDVSPADPIALLNPAMIVSSAGTRSIVIG
jgi:hypothetical protein